MRGPILQKDICISVIHIVFEKDNAYNAGNLSACPTKLPSPMQSLVASNQKLDITLELSFPMQSLVASNQKLDITLEVL